MCAVLLPPGANPFAVNKIYLSVSKPLLFWAISEISTVEHDELFCSWSDTATTYSWKGAHTLLVLSILILFQFTQFNRKIMEVFVFCLLLERQSNM
jgi:hypothetical protein